MLKHFNYCQSIAEVRASNLFTLFGAFQAFQRYPLSSKAQTSYKHGNFLPCDTSFEHVVRQFYCIIRFSSSFAERFSNKNSYLHLNYRFAVFFGPFKSKMMEHLICILNAFSLLLFYVVFNYALLRLCLRAVKIGHEQIFRFKAAPNTNLISIFSSPRCAFYHY